MIISVQNESNELIQIIRYFITMHRSQWKQYDNYLESVWKANQVSNNGETVSELRRLIGKSQELRRQITECYVGLADDNANKFEEEKQGGEFKSVIESLENKMFNRLKNFCLKTGKSQKQVMHDFELNEEEAKNFEKQTKMGHNLFNNDEDQTFLFDISKDEASSNTNKFTVKSDQKITSKSNLSEHKLMYETPRPAYLARNSESRHPLRKSDFCD